MRDKIVITAGNKLVIKKGNDKYKEGEELDLIEAAYLLYQNKAIVIDDENRNIDLKKLFIKYGGENEWWILFTVFTDLVKRGFKVKRGYSDRDLLAVKGDRKYRILVTEEGIKVKLSNLVSWIENTYSKDLNAIIAVVDMYGDVTYYHSIKHKMTKPKLNNLNNT